MSDDTRRWRRHERAGTVSDALQLLRRSIQAIRADPDDDEARRRLRAVAAEQGLWEQLALLLADEARAHADRPALAAVFYEELADAYDALDQPIETIAAMEALIAAAPDVIAHHERIAHLYRQAGAWAKAADAFEQIARLSPDRKGEAALAAAAKLNREHGRLDRAATQYRAIVGRRPTDLGSWRALDDVLSELGQWREVADVRGERAARTRSGFEKAALLRAQARALEQAGDLPGAAHVVARASDHAPDDVSGQVDHADVLARSGQGRVAAAILRTRVDEAIDRGASPDDVAALRLRLAQVLEDSCDDRPAAIAVLDELLMHAPAHLPALERITALAATDPDPRAHAQALLRYAAAIPDDAERAAYIAAAGRRLHEAGDLRGAMQALEQAVALSGADPEIEHELEDVKAAAIVERARQDAGAGDLEGAERRLRAILDTHRHHVDANLALAELLVGTERAEAAADHLRDTLGTMPDDTPGPEAARMVHRFSQVMAALGDDDESHQLLHEAHRLDRSSLRITLALGESCFARKLWRQAALHLSAAAEHPDAARRPREIALGLVHAAQAETRALRPENAGKHYDAAVRIDPGCAPAWHGLAAIAMERGELERAAECLEHEAAVTTEPRDRLRLYDALGDMALDVLGDPARAERCWQQVAELDSAPVLDKLLALQRRREATHERAATCARLARIVDDPAQRKALLLEAAAITRTVVFAEEILAAFPRDADVVVCAATIALDAGDPQRAGAWLRRAPEGDPRLAALWRRLGDDARADAAVPRPRAMAADEAYAAALDDDDRRELIDDPDDAPLRDVLALLGEAMALVCPTPAAALADAGLADAQRVTPASGIPAAVMLPQIARMLGGPPTLLFTSPGATEALALVVASPPVVVIGPQLAGSDAALRFQIGRIVELSRPHRVFTALPADAFARLIAGLRHAFAPAGAATPDVVAEAERLRGKLSVALRQRMTERLAGLGALDAAAYAAACDRAADRAGLIACGDVTVVSPCPPHLVRLASSPRYLAVSKKLRERSPRGG